MKISLVQSDTLWEDKAGNFLRLSDLLSGIAGKTDLVVLPEMFNTGFTLNSASQYEEPGGETQQWMSAAASRYGFAVCGTFIVKEGGSFLNRFLFITPDGSVKYYDKRHLFTLAGEHTCYTHGNKRLVFEYQGFRISSIICYDLRFPVWCRNRNDYDLLICPANWPVTRKLAWNTLLRARAIENQCYVAGVNRTGRDGNGLIYAGESAIISFNGETITEAGNITDRIITTGLSLDELNEFRSRYPFYGDADEFELK